MRQNKKPVRCVIVFLALLAVSAPATADSLDDILNVAVSVGLVNKDLAKSKPVIECMIGGGNAATCTGAALDLREEAVGMLPPTDSNIKLIVDLVHAVRGERWLKALELGGKNGAMLACQLVPGGALRDFFCSGIAKIAQDKVAAVYAAIFEGDWWKLLTLADPTVACELMPGDVKAVLCSGLLQVAKEILVLAEDIGSFFAGIGNDLVELFLGAEDPPKDPQKYYASSWRLGNLHWVVVESLKKDGINYNVTVTPPYAYGDCVTEYDNHQLSEEQAKKLCQQMQQRFMQEAIAYKKFLVDSIPAYLEGALEPRKFAMVVENWRETEPGFNKDLENRCAYALSRMAAAPGLIKPYWSSDPPTDPRNWICTNAILKQFYPRLPAAKQQLQNEILKPLTKAPPGSLKLAPGMCKLETPTHRPKLYVSCKTFESYRQCGTIFNGLGIDQNKEIPNCKLEGLGLPAAKTLASQIVKELGAARCSLNYLTVECTREWKVQACLARVGEELAGTPSTYRPDCQYRSTPEYEAAKLKARSIINKLNGSGQFEIGPQGQAIPTTAMQIDRACYLLPDPLVIDCRGRYEAPTTEEGPLPYCAQDPNRDGVDAPCYLDKPNRKLIPTDNLIESDAALNSGPTDGTLTPPGPQIARPVGTPKRTDPLPGRSANVQPQAAPSRAATPRSAPVAQETPPAMAVQAVAPSSQPEAGPGAAPARTAAPAIRAMSAQQGESIAPPNPCRLEVTYYVPNAPVIESSSPSLQVGDQVQIQCGFEKRSRQLEWQQCDDEAKIAMNSLKFSQESGSRYSGMMIVDDTNVGIATSPTDGSSFDNTGTWVFNEAGSHEVTCQVDNGLHIAGTESPVYLQAAASLRVGGQSGPQEFRAFEPGRARKVMTTSRQTESAPLARDGRIRFSGDTRTVDGNSGLINPSLNPQPEVPSARQPGGNDMINPSLNPQPEVPSARQPAADEMINPSLNPQPEVPSARQPGADEMINPSLNPQPEVPSARQPGTDEMINPSLNPQPEVPSRRLDPDGATMMPAPLPEPPSPNLDNHTPDNFTGAAGQNSSQSFDPQTQFMQVRHVQGNVATDNDMNGAGNSATPATTARAAAAITRPANRNSGGAQRISPAAAVTPARTPLTCKLYAVGGSAMAKTTTYEFWVENTAATAVNPGRTVVWQAEGVTVTSSVYGPKAATWTTEGSFQLPAILSVGQKIKVGKKTVSGKIQECVMWAE